MCVWVGDAVAAPRARCAARPLPPDHPALLTTFTSCASPPCSIPPTSCSLPLLPPACPPTLAARHRRSCDRSVVFVLDDFDLFATRRAKQTLLYNLLDALQVCCGLRPAVPVLRGLVVGVMVIVELGLCVVCMREEDSLGRPRPSLSLRRPSSCRLVACRRRWWG